ncbi:MAG: hypothetical protein WBL40_12765 [Terrimicrobiaceae bacterium]
MSICLIAAMVRFRAMQASSWRNATYQSIVARTLAEKQTAHSKAY